MGGSDDSPEGDVSKKTPPEPATKRGFNWSKFFSMVFWFLLHGMVVVALFLNDSEIKEDVETDNYGHLQAIMYFLVMAITGVLFIRASTMSPGWITPPPPRVQADETSEPGAVVPLKNDPSSGRAKEEPVDPTCRFCLHCNLWQKLRSKHCMLCNKCVAKYDHHCFWMGNCIGEKNHGVFWWFLFLESTLILWSVYLVIEGLTWAHMDSVSEFLEFNLLPCLCVVGILVVGWLPIALLGLHTYLILTNQTTWEFNRRRKITYLHGLADGVHPFSRGCVGNVDLICCDFDPTPRYWRGISNEIGKM